MNFLSILNKNIFSKMYFFLFLSAFLIIGCEEQIDDLWETDDDAGTMSSWFVMRSIGLSPANIGDPVYYLTAPIFKSVKINWENGKSFEMEVINYNKDHFYVQSAQLNGKELSRNWLTHEELTSGGNLIIETADTPNKDWGTQNTFITKVELN